MIACAAASRSSAIPLRGWVTRGVVPTNRMAPLRGATSMRLARFAIAASRRSRSTLTRSRTSLLPNRAFATPAGESEPSASATVAAVSMESPAWRGDSRSVFFPARRMSGRVASSCSSRARTRSALSGE